ncbi:M16 family metallopeptidase [Winogradskyella arenosi]|uniref:Putative Zn-dependent peptidase n=1 Tax=Winogradskyella arenosi TaxID=533325 RepID=A0A368ZJ07_9FLAO|nr:pitrilysin family protein [Winogradskyella arenosi]RCW93741.1 putative Zn-dependent peptidase [Winogradskyella arenosi]
MKTALKMNTKIVAFFALFILTVSANAQIDRSKPPVAGPEPEISIDKPEEFTLKNGLKVMVVENHKLPKVSYSLRIDNPPIATGKKAGIESLIGSMLGNGTTSISKDEFNEEIDFLGANLNFGITGGFASSLSKYSDRILELMADAAINPLLTEEEFEKEKTKLLEGLKADAKSTDAIASRVGYALSFGTKHPYGEYVTEETINNVSFGDALAFYEKNFNPENAYLVVIGDVDYKTVKKQIKKYFKDWKKSVDIKHTVPKPNPNVQYTQINFVNVPGATQSNLSITNNVDLKMSDEDYHAALITNNILGGGGEGYLFKNLREEHGYTYGAYSNLGNDRYGAARFSATAKVRNAVTDSAVVEALKEINRIRTEPVDAQLLKDAKAKYVGNFVMALERPQTVANYALNIELNNLPEDFYTTYLQKINDVSVEDIQRVANKYFKADNLRIVVVGNGAEVLENLEKTGIPIMYYDTYANPTEKPKFEVKLPEGVNAKSVFNAYIDAIGGKEKVAAINSILVKYEASAMGATVISEEKKMDGKLKQTIFMNGNAMMTVLTTQEKVTMNNNPLPENMVNDMKTLGGLFTELNLLNNDSAKITAIESVEGRDAYKVQVPGEVVSLTYYYDVETGLKVKEVQTTSMQGQTQSQEVVLKDYKDFEGIKFPATREGTQMGQLVVYKLLEAKLNEGVSDADFN